ncbi:MAG: hypothetical protein LBK52_01560 [Deltaproteobacteria bacterium]|jgi:Rod binding domain-containing protein|nr:hypothetical protein [Deltaproteobacteria bacterium]
MSSPESLNTRGLPLRQSSVRPLRRTAGRNSEAAVRRFSVQELKEGRDFSQIIDLAGKSPDSRPEDNRLEDSRRPRPESGGTQAPSADPSGNAAGSGQSAPGTGTAAGSGWQTAPETEAAGSGKPAPETEAAASLGQPAGPASDQMFRGRYLGRKSIAPGRLQGAKSAELTEEEKIAQLKKIKTSAQDYEGLLIKEMIKSMRQSPLAKTAGSETYSEIAEKPFTAALTAAGGLGLADKIVADVARQEGLMDTLDANPEIMGPGWRPKIAPSRMRKAPSLPAPAKLNSEPESR